MRDKILPSQNIKVLQAALLKDNRFANRAMTATRDVNMQCGPAYGQCCVKYGKTQVLCNTSASVIRALPERPREGTSLFGGDDDAQVVLDSYLIILRHAHSIVMHIRRQISL